jgi:WD40 repeat protein
MEDEKAFKEESTSHISEDSKGPDSDSEPESTENKLESGDKMISINLLDYRKLSKIKKDFKLKREGLLKPQFINIMLHHLPEIEDQVSLVNSLNELFAEIDVNDDKHLEWDEFSNYIIEIGLARKDQGFVQVIKNYKPSEWRDTVKHDNDIEYITYFPETKHLLVTERDNKKFKIYNMKTGKFEGEVKGHTGAVISAYHIHDRGMVVTSSNDLSIILWEDSSYSQVHKINSPIIPISMTYFDSVLYAGGPEGMIFYWNLSDLTQRLLQHHAFPRVNDFYHDKSAVTAMMPIPSLDLLVTSDLGGQILLWNVPSLEPNRKMKRLPKGIYSLDWSSDVGCLFSAGLDRAAYVWNPYVTKYIYKLSGHIHSLVGIKCVPDSHQLVTADISGMFKVWDIRTFTCIQSFNAPVAELNTFSVTFPEKKIVAGAKRLFIYTYEEPKDQNKVDEGIPLMCLYNPLYNTFISAHPSCVKIWNAADGQLIKVLRNLTPNDITTIQLDNKKRKLFLGDSKGRVLTFKVKNGTKIKKFKRHGGEVTSLLFLPEFKYLVSCSWDRKVHVHDDSEGGEKGSIRFDQIKHKDIVNSIDLKAKGKYLASCSDDGTILITNLQTLRQDTELQGHEAEVKALKFLNPHSCLVAADLSGFLYIWAVAPSNVKNTLLLKVSNKITKDTGGTDSCPVRALEWDFANELLYGGDDLGNINVWSLSLVLQKLKLYGSKREDSGSDPDTSFFILTLLTNALESNKKVVSEDFRKVSEWKAHEEGIIHLSLVEGVRLIVSCSFDYHVFIWDVNGVQLGSLVVMGDPRWKVKIDTQTRVETARKEATALLEESKMKSYDEVILDLTRDEKNISKTSKNDLSTIDRPDESDDEKEKNILNKLDMTFPERKEVKLVKVETRKVGKSLNNTRVEPNNRSTAPKRNLSNSGRRIITRK